MMRIRIMMKVDLFMNFLHNPHSRGAYPISPSIAVFLRVVNRGGGLSFVRMACCGKTLHVQKRDIAGKDVKKLHSKQVTTFFPISP